MGINLGILGEKIKHLKGDIKNVIIMMIDKKYNFKK